MAFAIGTMIPPSARRRGRLTNSDDPNEILRAIERANAILVDRLAPDPLWHVVRLQNLAAGGIVSVTLARPFNGVLVSLTQGNIDVFFGQSASTVPDLAFGPALNPVPVYMPMQDSRHITLVCNASSPNPAYGSVIFMAY